MKRFYFGATVILFAAAVSALGQATRPATTPSPRPATPPAGNVARPPATNAPLPETKIALIDTNAFSDEKRGITRYVNAVKAVRREFEPRQAELNTIQTRIRTIADEINKLRGAAVVDPKTITAKQDEGERLQRDLKYKKEQADADFEKRYTEVVGPVSADVGKALDQFAVQRGITMLLDVSKLLPAILTLNPATDLTQTFISEYNTRNP